MALLKRDFFVPYVKNLCALHLLRGKLKERMEYIRYEIETVKKGQPEPRPTRPNYETPWSGGRILGVFLAVVWAVIWIIAPDDIAPSFNFVSFLFVAVSVVIIGFIIYGVKCDIDNNDYEKTRYEEEARQAKRIHDQNVQNRERKLPGLWNELEECRAAYEETSRVLLEMYDANVIPGQYRNIHSVIYLYDWFSKSREEDLGLALNTFVLEQIKDKLDTIIRNQGDILLNQQMQLSLQMQSNEEQESYFRTMENKINQLEMADEERNKNMDMIARTNESVLWYAQQDYIRNMFM